jgi:hypothetical protein
LILHAYRNDRRNACKLAIYEYRENGGKTSASRLPGEKMTQPKSYEGIINSVEYRVTRRALQRRFVRKKPNMRERLALDNAARTWVRAQWASTDSSISPDELCKVNAAARRAHDLLRDH